MCVSSVPVVFPIEACNGRTNLRGKDEGRVTSNPSPSLSLQLETLPETPDDFVSGSSQNYLIFQGSLIVITIQALSQQVFRKCLCL